VGAATFAFVWLATPPGRDVNTAGQFVLKLFAFLCLCAAVALVPWLHRRMYLLLLVPFLFFAGYLLPRISYFYYGDTHRLQGDEFYSHMYLLLYPGIVVTAAGAYRLGGGSPGRTFKIATSGIIIVFSGLLDLMWMIVNPVPIPATIDAPHINVFTGGPISFTATIWFALAHIPLLVGVNALPLDRWLGRIGVPAGPTPARER
jgi:hypothetical protein